MGILHANEVKDSILIRGRRIFNVVRVHRLDQVGAAQSHQPFPVGFDEPPLEPIKRKSVKIRFARQFPPNVRDEGLVFAEAPGGGNSPGGLRDPFGERRQASAGWRRLANIWRTTGFWSHFA